MRTKKILSAVLAITMCCLAMVGCSSNSAESTESTNNIVETASDETRDINISDDELISFIKEGHFSEYPGKTIGDAFAAFFKNGEWSAEKGTVLFTGDFEDAEGEKTVGIRYNWNPDNETCFYDYMALGGDANGKSSNVVKEEQYPQLMRAVFANEAIPTVKVFDEDDEYDNLKGVWLSRPLGVSSTCAALIINVKNVDEEHIEYEAGYCFLGFRNNFAGGEELDEWTLSSSEEVDEKTNNSDISIRGNELFWTYDDTSERQLYKTSFRTLEEALEYYRSEYDENVIDTYGDGRGNVTKPIRTPREEFCRVISSEYDKLDPEWYTKINCFEYTNNYERTDSVTFYDAGNGLLGISYSYTFQDTEKTEQNRVFIDPTQYDVDDRNGVVYQILEYTENEDKEDECVDEEYERNYGYSGYPGFYKLDDSYITYYPRSMDDEPRIYIQVDSGLGEFGFFMDGITLYDGGNKEVSVSQPDADVAADTEGKRIEDGDEEAQQSLDFDVEWYKKTSNFASNDGTTLEIFWYDDGELNFDVSDGISYYGKDYDYSIGDRNSDEIPTSYVYPVTNAVTGEDDIIIYYPPNRLEVLSIGSFTAVQ